MSNDNYYHDSTSRLAYDGKLLPADDAMARYERDEKIREKYEEAEPDYDDQITWDEIKSSLEI